ncbi:hypothetical protein AYO49_05115 [Verrucomicrobiaceae bacterium SCGC AG-212-N21]|nr:hypothetical protein AYO49_05115 [Verrucomicrobiaceae bacterium SCGC AG-212-N21]
MRLLTTVSAVLFFSISPILVAHPLPDIPVRGSFEEDGRCAIRIEIDPRCFLADPEEEAFLMKVVLEKLYSPADQEELKKKAADLIARGVEFQFEPTGVFKPEFTWEFTGVGNTQAKNFDDTMVLTGTWQSKVPDGVQGYSIRALDPNNLAVYFINTLHGKPVERVAVLFPHEKSFVLDLSGKNASASTAPPEITADSSPSVASQPKPKSKSGLWWRGAALLVATGVILWLAKLGRN